MDESQSTVPFELKNFPGFCPICERDTTFVANGPFFRNHLRCPICTSPPRARALIYVLERVAPHWRTQKIHECSPSNYWASAKIASQSSSYTPTYFDPITPLGTTIERMKARCENLEAQTFPDEEFDIVITQDVFEHLMDPGAAAAEIARTLKPGGIHIFTVPLTRGFQSSRRLAGVGRDSEIEHYVEPSYHGDPINETGSLVTMDWGHDIADFIQRRSGLTTTIYDVDRIDLGIRAELNHVLVSRKSGRRSLEADVPV